ncbi:MAG: hypothetical protein ACLGHG_05265 [Gammaproteobacteria bacterium]
MAVSKAAKTKSPLNELIERVDQLTARVREEREKQMARLEDQLDKARDLLNKQLESLHINQNLDKLKDLQETYRGKAEDVIRNPVDTVKTLVGDAGDQVRDSKAVHALLKAELNALQFATKQAQEVARVLSSYEKQVQKQLTQVENKISKATRTAGKAVKKKAAPARKAAAPKARAKAAPKAKPAAAKKAAPGKKKAPAKG